jgi:hypothetical protein
MSKNILMKNSWKENKFKKNNKLQATLAWKQQEYCCNWLHRTTGKTGLPRWLHWQYRRRGNRIRIHNLSIAPWSTRRIVETNLIIWRTTSYKPPLAYLKIPQIEPKISAEENSKTDPNVGENIAHWKSLPIPRKLSNMISTHKNYYSFFFTC